MLQGVATPDADIDVSTLKHVRNDIGVMNERWVRKLRGVSATDVLDRFRATTAQRREALTAMSDAEWNQITATPAGPDTYGRFMRVRDFDCWMHEHDIREALVAPAVGRRPRRARRPAGARRDGGQHGLRRRQARQGARRVAGGDRADGAAGADHPRCGRRAAARWSTTSAGRSRRRRSGWTGCSSPGWRAAGRRPPRHDGRHRNGGDRGSRRSGSSTPQLCDLSCETTFELGWRTFRCLVVTGVPLNVLPKVGGDARG